MENREKELENVVVQKDEEQAIDADNEDEIAIIDQNYNV